MQVFERIGPLRDTLARHRSEGLRIGLVPTMGYLHDGHAALLEKAASDCDIVVCSVFVNPLQFNNISDLENYPTSWDKDLQLAEEKGCDYIFKPSAEEMYPREPAVSIRVPTLGSMMEGAFRPGHFEGVALVVLKLLQIVDPDRAYFGEKDRQQLSLVQQLVLDLNFDLEIVPVQTQRESSGLALSSRNARLSDQEKQQASNIYRSLSLAKEEIQATGDIKAAIARGSTLLEETGINPEYFQVVDAETFEVVNALDDRERRTLAICTAATIGDVRLIDNISVRLGNDD